MSVLRVPDPSLVVLIGAAGAGKTTFAAGRFAPGEILSSDAFRALIAGSEDDQTATRAAFGALHRALTTRLAAGALTVVDATNVETTARRALLARARTAGLPSVAIVLALPEAVVRSRNAARPGRQVPDDVVGHHLGRVGRLLAHDGALLRAEGFALVHVLRTAAELDGLSIVRSRPATGAPA